MKIRIEGTEKQLEDAVVELRKVFIIRSVSKTYRNRNDDKSRVYLDTVDIDPTDEVLTPSYHGERCRHSGADPQYECCCDECDYFLCCFPEYEK